MTERFSPRGTGVQNSRPIDTRDWPYKPIERLQHRGFLLSLNPSEQPYTTGAVRQALQAVDTTALSPIETQW